MRVLQFTYIPFLVVGSLFTPAAFGETIGDALQKGLIELRINGTGASSGDAIRFHVKKIARAGPGVLRVSVPAGLMLDSDNRSNQDMVVYRVKGRAVDAIRDDLPPTSSRMVRKLCRSP